MQDILEKVMDIEDSLWYDIGSQMSLEVMHSNAYMNHAMEKSSEWMIGAVPKGIVRQTMANMQSSKPIQTPSSNTCKTPAISSKQPLEESELKCYQCGQKGHMQSQCAKLRS